jgi:lysophospholipase L1-like esterase
MRYLLLAIVLICIQSFCEAQKIKIQDTLHFLALGDSYTIGQSVPMNDRWPSQLATELTNEGYNIAEVKFIAQTGWRTDNLQNAIEEQKPLTGFNMVSLLIGVNNQYQGGNTTTYYSEFDNLIKTALLLASNKPEHVFVLSIPDYAYTPYGGGSSVISNQIDQFNSVNKIITESYGVTYIDITPISRMGLLHPELVAADGLHPSGIMYGMWVQEILKNVEHELGLSDAPDMDAEVTFSIRQRQLTINSEKHGGSLLIYNSNGQVVLDEMFSATTQNDVSLSDLASGLYVLILENKGRMLFKSKFILQ